MTTPAFIECLTTPSFFFVNTQSVFVIATGRWLGSAEVGHQDTGRCKLTRDGVDSSTSGFSAPMRSGQNGDMHNAFDRAASLSLLGVEMAVPPGLHTWSIECNEDSGDMRYFDLAIAAVPLGP